ncbi:hypothetical protein V1227_13750 [Lentzea sp. DG1S-22]|uniref:hypothetical protein n=1 Tax=Lentzea sp. DG1S-22 TaxID=3108822 RepID=UPI002E78A9CE|nr:hypothetical protein [Lentzea sp. DG1S-22]WVH83766.1 hypothetical protein V1227_13750 [Lentzea sp. DG1S-22]
MFGALETCWEVASAGHWDRVRAVLEADIAHRGREMARHGLATMLGGLSERISFPGPAALAAVLGRVRADLLTALA